MSAGDRIKEIRKKKGITQVQLAEASGVAAISIHQYEAGKREPRLSLVEKIADVLEVPASYLMGWEELDNNTWGKEASDEAYIKLAENIEKFRGAKAKMNTAFDRLNAAGQQKALERVEELTEIPKYQKKPDKG